MDDDNLCTMNDETHSNCALHPDKNISHSQRMVSVPWAKLNEHDKNAIISIFDTRVFDKVGIDISLYENGWLAEYVLSGSWNNLMGPARRLYAEYKRNLSDSDGDMIGTSLNISRTRNLTVIVIKIQMTLRMMYLRMVL